MLRLPNMKIKIVNFNQINPIINLFFGLRKKPNAFEIF